jgi:GR25 family glycosyltransferase involved in LPS biosynthesis
MKIDFSKIKKYVINLERRKDRLEHFINEMKWIGWEFERFEAIDTSSYIGCALSHQKLAEGCLQSEDEYFMFLEDDIFFMPYSKEQVLKCEKELNEMEFDFFHLAPSLHRPVNNLTENIMDITNLPEKDINKHREVFGTSAFILNKKACEYILNWNTNKYVENSHEQIPIDEYLAKVVYPNIIAVSSSYPIVTQIDDFSDINKGFYNNHYLMTYNWNYYTSNKLENSLMDLNHCKKTRE